MSVWHIIGLLVIAYIVYWTWSWLFWKGPKEGSRELAMAVWGSFGPYYSAEHAESSFRSVCKIVFAPDRVADQEQWMSDQIQVFHDTEAAHEDDFEARLQRILVPLSHTARGNAFRQAQLAVREQALVNVKESAEQFKALLGAESKLAGLLDNTIEQSRQRIETEKQRFNQEN